MKKQRIFLMAVMLLTLAMPAVAWAKMPGSIHVKGTGVVLVQPDVAAIHIAMEEKAPTGEGAQSKNNAAVAAVKKALFDAGIAKDNMVTTYTALSPEYSYEDNGKRSLMGYRANTTMDVYTDKVDAVGTYIDVAVKAGATRIDNVTFSISDHSRYYGQALQMAVKNAEASAKSIAAAYGKPLGQVLEVVENTGSPAVAQPKEAMGANFGRTEGTGADAAPTQIHYDKIQVFADLSVVYSLLQ